MDKGQLLQLLASREQRVAYKASFLRSLLGLIVQRMAGALA